MYLIQFRFLTFITILCLGISDLKAQDSLQRNRSVTLVLDNVRVRDRDFDFLRTREGEAVTNQVNPYIIQLSSNLRLLNPIAVELGATPILGRSFRVSFSEGSRELGYETKTRLLSFIQGLDDMGEVRGLVVVASSDTDGDQVESQVSVATDRAQSVKRTLEEAGLSEEKIYLGNLAELASSSSLEAANFDILVIQ